MSVKNIVSFSPAATEIIYALGLESQLSGRSHACDYPESVKDLPACTSDSKAVNKQILEGSTSICSLDKELVRRLNPDVIITQLNNNACAVNENEVQEMLPDSKLISLQFDSLPDIFNTIKLIAGHFGVEEQGNRLLEDLLERTELIKHKLKFIDEKPKTACIEWLSPLKTSGKWMPELIEAAGGRPVPAESGMPSCNINPEVLTAANPEVVLIVPCGFSILRTLQEVHLLAEIPGWNELDAVKNNQIYIADGSRYFNRPGPRIVDSIEILAEILNPKQFAFGYEGEGWIKFDFNAG